MKDFQGNEIQPGDRVIVANEIQPGDRVIVAQRKGSSLWLVAKTVSFVEADTGIPHLKHGDKTRKYMGGPDAISVVAVSSSV